MHFIDVRAPGNNRVSHSKTGGEGEHAFRTSLKAGRRDPFHEKQQDFFPFYLKSAF